MSIIKRTDFVGPAIALLVTLGFTSCGPSPENTTIEGPVMAPAPSPAKTHDIPKDGPPGMVWIPGGQFTMGALNGDN